MKKFLLIVTVMLFGFTFAEDFLDVDDAFKLSVNVTENTLEIDFDIADDYYLYRDNYHLYGKEGAKLSEAQFSDNVKIKYDPNFDEDMAVFYNTMSVSHSFIEKTGQFQVVYQGCADAGLCYPPQKRLFDLQGNPVEIAIASVTSLDSLDLVEMSEQPAPVETSNLTVLSAIAFAIVGGLILNLMPCVFPVLSLKAMHMAQFGQDQSHAKAHGLAYTLGVVLSFVAVAGVLLAIRFFGEWVGWGFQLQSPYFVAGLVLLFFAMSLTMTGYVEFGQNLMGVGQGLTQKTGLTGSFFTGVLATVVATPCTAPFMGSAIGFALLQPAYVSLLIFSAMGLGLALPILAISYLPGLARWMPKPGAWMNVFRQLMAFPLFATALWLMWVLIEIKGSDALLKVGIGLIIFTVAIWPALNISHKQGLFGKVSKTVVRYNFLLLALFMVLDQRTEVDIWEEYSPQLLEESLAQGKTVFVDITAAWCITCKANERVALSGDRFEALVDDNEIVLIKADWTNPSPEVDALIASYNRDGVPLYAFYFKGAVIPEILPQILTSGLINDYFSGNNL
jgi:thiol:disulfide interchange protein DsbD